MQYLVQQHSVAMGFFLDSMEWYIYPYLVPQISEALFGGNVTLAWLMWAVSYAVGPIGNVLFGSIADAYGRKTSFVASSVVLVFGTLGQGLTPRVPYLGAVWMLAFRSLQGLGYAGKFSVSHVYLAETTPKPILAMSRAIALLPSAFALVAISAIVVPVSTLLTRAQMLQWGWRVPFLFTGLLGPLPLLLFYKDAKETLSQAHLDTVSESSSEPGNGNAEGPLPRDAESDMADLFQHHWRQLVLGTAGLLSQTTFEALGFAYQRAWLMRWCMYTDSQAGLFIGATAALYAPITMSVLSLADTFGLGKVGLGCSLTAVVLSVPTFLPPIWNSRLCLWGPCLVSYALLHACRSLSVVWAVDLFPQSIRARAFGMSQTAGFLVCMGFPALSSGRAMNAIYFTAGASAVSATAFAYALMCHHSWMTGKGEERGMQVAHLRSTPY